MVGMNKILVIGSGGAGKSTFAKRLGAVLKLEVIHLDALYWSSGWVEMPKDEWRVVVEELLRRDSWIMDGNYGGTLDIRLGACDAVIFLDLPRLVCLLRVLKRRALYRKKSRPDMANGCDEKLNWEFLKWVWNYPSKKKPAVLEKLKRYSQTKSVIILRSDSEIESFFEELSHSLRPRKELSNVDGETALV
jgi:adenylate kinase family enzyme